MAFRTVTELTAYQCTALMALVTENTVLNGDLCMPVDVYGSKKFSLNTKGYLQLKVPYDPNHFLMEYRLPGTCTNKKVQLHQLVMWMAELEGVFLHRAAIEGGELELSHLCGLKTCANSNHIWPETSACNKSRNYCEVVINVDGVLFNICRHHPRCIATEAKQQGAMQLKTQ